jgi:hypothetical protein
MTKDTALCTQWPLSDASGGDIWGTKKKEEPSKFSSCRKYPGGVARRAAGATPPNRMGGAGA